MNEEAVRNRIKILMKFKNISQKDMARSGRKNVGTYTVKVTGIGNYSGSISKTFKIIPKSTSIKSITSDYNKITVKWKAQKKQTTKYQIEYALNSSFKNSKKVKVALSKTSYTIKNLTPYKTYYVRIRTYKTSGSKTYYSKWSKKKSVYVW